MQVLFFIFSKFFPSPARESSPGISRGCSLPVTPERAQAMVRVLAAAAAVVAAVAAAIIPATTVVAAATATAVICTTTPTTATMTSTSTSKSKTTHISHLLFYWFVLYHMGQSDKVLLIAAGDFSVTVLWESHKLLIKKS